MFSRINIIWVLIMLSMAYMAYAMWPEPRVVVVTEYVTEQIDENLWVSKAEYLSEKDLTAKLRQDSTRFARELRETRQRLVQSIDLNARLRLERDSLLNNPTIIEIVDNKLDTLLTYYYADSLLAVTASVKIDSVFFTHDISVSQLRPIHLQINTTQDRNGVYVYVESNDLTIDKINSTTTIDIKRKKWYHYFGLGLATGVLTWELLR
jgi:hypothetical protein